MSNFDDYVKKIRKENKYDPRRDLVKDSKLWYILLNIAERKDDTLYNLFHGLRCVGARLVYQKGSLSLKQGKDIKNNSDWEKYRVDWLYPHAKKVKEIFGDVERYIKNKK